MSHIDKGALHAYLDGALDEYPAAEAERIRDHLDACGACSERLAQERAVRSEASTILGYATPDVDLPTLEELRAYVKATRQSPRPVAVRIYRMGWAASIVLALGAGWMVRDGQLQQVPVMDRGNFESSIEAGADAPASAESADRFGAVEAETRSASGQGAGGQTSDLVAEPDVVADGPVARRVSAPPPEPGVVGGLEEREISTAVMADADAAKLNEAVAENSPAAPGRAAGAEALADRDVDDVVADPATAEVTAADAAADLATIPEVPADRVASLPMLQGVLDSIATEASADLEAEEPKEEQDERSRAESAVPVTSAFATGGTRSVRQDEFEEARTFEDEPALVLPGYEVISITSMGEGSTAFGVHVVQRIEDDLTVELFRLEPGVAPSELPAAGGGRNELRAETPDGWIVIRGALTEVQLEVLLVSLFQG